MTADNSAAAPAPQSGLRDNRFAVRLESLLVLAS
jgi:hypothetical protein